MDVFKIICQIGEGTYGQVYKAKDLYTGELSNVPEKKKTDVRLAGCLKEDVNILLNQQSRAVFCGMLFWQ